MIHSFVLKVIYYILPATNKFIKITDYKKLETEWNCINEIVNVNAKAEEIFKTLYESILQNTKK